MSRNTFGLKRGGSPGRPKGMANKVTIEVRELAQRIVMDPAYQRSLHRRLLAGTAPQLEALLWQYAFGKPRDKIEDREDAVNGFAGLTPNERPDGRS